MVPLSSNAVLLGPCQSAGGALESLITGHDPSPIDATRGASSGIKWAPPCDPVNYRMNSTLNPIPNRWSRVSHVVRSDD